MYPCYQFACRQGCPLNRHQGQVIRSGRPRQDRCRPTANRELTIKSPNIFITTRGHPKILDFGLAKHGPSAKPADRTSLPTEEYLTTPGVAVGTVPYMSPEQARGSMMHWASPISGDTRADCSDAFAAARR